MPNELDLTGNFTTPLFKDSYSALSGASSDGTVGICLSGGGSRALAAGIGQLQALGLLAYGSKSLLDLVQIMTTVSGGGWVGIPFVFLPTTYLDTDYLGDYVGPADLSETYLNATPQNWVGTQVTADFSIPDLAAAAYTLHESYGVPESMLWQTLMGIHFLSPYGLYANSNYVPGSFYTYNEVTLARDVTSLNPQLANEPVNLVEKQDIRERRPFLVSVAGMFVNAPDGLALAPIQSSTVFTGVAARPAGATYGDNYPLVGGSVTASFAFNSTYVSTQSNGDEAIVSQDRQWSLTDILGTSSAAFAALLEQHIAEWTKSPQRLAAALRLHQDSIVRTLSKAGKSLEEAASTVESLIAEKEAMALVSPAGDLSAPSLGGIANIIPAYNFWDPNSPPPANSPQNLPFADGGSLDNTGVTSMLLYPSVANLIVFTNAESALKKGLRNIEIESSIPPLFGLQPYSVFHEKGYIPYTSGSTDLRRKNQVFPQDAFWDLLAGLWQSIGNNESNAPFYSQTLVTVENPWFNIPAGRTVTVLWFYLGLSQVWAGQVNPSVQSLLKTQIGLYNFPNFSTEETQLSAGQVHFLSNLTAWTVMQRSEEVTALFG